MRAPGKSLGSAPLQILWGSLCLLQGRWLLRINTALLQRTTPLARFFHSIVYSFIQLFLSTYYVPGVWIAARGTTETKSLPSRIEISMRQSGTAVQL